VKPFPSLAMRHLQFVAFFVFVGLRVLELAGIEFGCGLVGVTARLLRLIRRSSNRRNPCGSDLQRLDERVRIPSSRSFSGRKPVADWTAVVWIEHPQINQSRTRFPYASQCVLLMVTTRSYMVSPPDAVAAFPSAEAV